MIIPPSSAGQAAGLSSTLRAGPLVASAGCFKAKIADHCHTREGFSNVVPATLLLPHALALSAPRSLLIGPIRRNRSIIRLEEAEGRPVYQVPADERRASVAVPRALNGSVIARHSQDRQRVATIQQAGRDGHPAVLAGASSEIDVPPYGLLGCVAATNTFS